MGLGIGGAKRERVSPQPMTLVDVNSMWGRCVLFCPAPHRLAWCALDVGSVWGPPGVDLGDRCGVNQWVCLGRSGVLCGDRVGGRIGDRSKAEPGPICGPGNSPWGRSSAGATPRPTRATTPPKRIRQEEEALPKTRGEAIARRLPLSVTLARGARRSESRAPLEGPSREPDGPRGALKQRGPPRSEERRAAPLDVPRLDVAAQHLGRATARARNPMLCGRSDSWHSLAPAPPARL